MSFEHIMLDLETLSTGPRAVIISIGAVRFDLNELQVGSNVFAFYEVVDGKSCQDYGLEIDFSTVPWWSQQSAEAKEALTLAERVPLPQVLLAFSRYARTIENSIIWGNGSTFDNIILRNAYKACDLPYPIEEKRDYCYRTMRKMFPDVEEDAFIGEKHDAMADARHQALHLIKIMRSISDRK